MKSLMTSILLLCSINSYAVLKINGAGASFPHAIYSKWFSEYSKQNSTVQFNYQAIGSGGGIRQLIKQTVDFGASDAPMKEKSKKKMAWEVMHVPTVLGAVSVAYNLPEVKQEIKLDGMALADIFLGKIAKWNDAKIAKLNPGVTLPNRDILVARRADGSGTTKVFADYLSEVSSEWKSKVGTGKALRWPVGIGSKGNDGVTNIIKQTTGAIGYIDLAHAVKNNLQTIALKNKSGEFVKPTVKSISLSATSFKTNGKDFVASVINQKGKGVYPISAFTYILLPIRAKDDKLNAIHKFLKWALSQGQGYAEGLYYAPLPTSLRKSILTTIEKL